MMTIPTSRAGRQRLDRSIARSFHGPIRAAFKTERTAVLKAATPAGAIAAVSDRLWTSTLTRLWQSPALIDLWTQQQQTLGIVGPTPVSRAARTRLRDIATDHALSIAETNRIRIARITDDAAKDADKARLDEFRPARTFRSTMRNELRTLYSLNVSDRAGNIAFTEALQATETVRYEAARNAAETATFATYKIWFTVGDSKVRPTHQAASGQQRKVNHNGWGGAPGRFNVGGASLEYPRDPSGPPGEVIGCRCWMEYRRIRKPER